MSQSARVRLCVCIVIVAIFIFLPALSHAQEFAGLVGRDDAHGDVPRPHVVLEPFEHAPPLDVGQVNVPRTIGPFAHPNSLFVLTGGIEQA